MKYLPESWENLFQWIKRLVREYEKENGVWSSLNIAVWEPDTIPPETLRKIVAKEVLSDENQNHNYWDNWSPDGLNRKLILHHSKVDIDLFPHLDSLILPWEKPMLWLLPIACWANIDKNFENNGYMVNAPAYDVVSTWAWYLWEESFIWPIYSHEDFKLKVSNLPSGKKPRLIVVVKPWNPCPVWASREEWEEIIEYAIKNNIRLVNDWAYSSVVHKNHISLSEVAKDYKDLDWIELFSISKTLSACGWRVWVAIWSKDFIWELTKIKWNTDSGAFWPALVWLNKYFDTPESKNETRKIQEMYKRRLDILIPIFEEAWLKLACPTDAWFFMLFKCPKFVDGEKAENWVKFNKLMINKIWLVWVPFTWSEINWINEQFIRYSACYDAEKQENVDRLKEALNKVKISY